MYILLTGIIINAITVTNSMSCDENWLEYQGKCLKLYNTAISWPGAYSTCVGLRNALLATVHSPETNIFVQNNITRGSDSWIGLSMPDIGLSSWKWSDGNDSSTYDDWIPTDVISACAVMKYDHTGYWYTAPCTNMKYYVCEKEMFADNCSSWLSFETHCYLILHKQAQTNMAAARNCWQYDAYLVSINSQPEADFIYSNLEIHGEYWIGLSPLRWVSGEQYQWNNWGDSGPTLNITYGCVYMNVNSGKWFCGHCGSPVSPNTLRPYVCQRDAVIDFPTTPNVVVEEDTPSYATYNESSTLEFVTRNVSNTHDSTDHSKQLLLTVIPAVCGGLVVVIVIIVVVVMIRRKRRGLASKDAKPNEQAIYYNEIKDTQDNGVVKRTDTDSTKNEKSNFRHSQTEDSQSPSVGDTERNTYEQLSVGPYVNSVQIAAGTYASLQ